MCKKISFYFLLARNPKSCLWEACCSLCLSWLLELASPPLPLESFPWALYLGFCPLSTFLLAFWKLSAINHIMGCISSSGSYIFEWWLLLICRTSSIIDRRPWTQLLTLEETPLQLWSQFRICASSSTSKPSWVGAWSKQNAQELYCFPGSSTMMLQYGISGSFW